MFDDPALQFELLAKTAFAALLGGAIGMEREQAGKPAGIRTQMLVCAGASLLMLIGIQLVEEFQPAGDGSSIRADPVRILQAIIIGVSFIGTGTIFTNSREERVEGLTTAATILLVTAIGVAVAIELYILAVGAAILSLAVLWGLRRFETAIGPKEPEE